MEPESNPTGVARPPSDGVPAGSPAVIDCPLVEPPALDLGPGSSSLLAEELREQVEVLREELRRVRELADRLLDGEEERAQERRTREVLFEKLDSARPQFQFGLIRPMVQRMATLFDLASDWSRQPPQDAAGFSRCLDLFVGQFREVLELHGIEIVAPEQDREFDRRFHHVVSTEPTGDVARHERVARLVQHGFVYFGQNDRTGNLTPGVIRPARVVLWKHDPNQPPPAPPAPEGPTERGE